MIDSYFLDTMDKVKSEPSEAFQSEEFHCPVEATLSLIGGKYKTLILWNLIGKTLRFSELRRLIPSATPKMLTQQLRELEDARLLIRKVYAEQLRVAKHISTKIFLNHFLLRAMLLPSLRDRADYMVRFLFGSFIAIGCFLVVWPFATAMSVAAVIAIVSWPLFKRVRKEVGGRNLVATLIMVSLLAILIVLPIAGLSLVSAQEIPTLIRYVREWIASGFTVPEELKEIPFVGEWAYTQAAHLLGNKEELAAIAQKLFDPVSRAALAGAVMLGDGLLQLFLMLFVIFFFYRDGEVLSQKSLALLTRMSGSIGAEVRDIIVNTTRSVVFGIVGSAAGQGVVALIGFWIAGVPGAITLGVAVFVLSAVPIGPPLVWGPAAFWLYYKGEVGMAIFLVLWGSLAVSSVDNFLKPILISKGASLPLSLIYLGVFGGVLAFGFMGIILGPVVIAVGIAMSKTWLSVSATVNDKDQPTAKTETVLKKLSKNSIESDIVSDVTGEQRSSNHHHYSQPKNDGQK